MGNRSCCSIRFAIFLSISLSASSSSPTILPFNSPSPSSIPNATPSDLLSLLGPPTQSSKINPLISQQLSSCLKFLVPFTPSKPKTPKYNGECYIKQRSLRLRSNSVISVERSKSEENELIWWPPEPVLELARLALDSGGDPASIHRALDPTVLPVPDVEGCKVNRCELTRTPYGRRFINEELNSYLEFLFELIVARGPSVGFNVSLNRYDLFHGHVFIARETGRLGILFHAREYPAYDKEVFLYKHQTRRLNFPTSYTYITVWMLKVVRLNCWELISNHEIISLRKHFTVVLIPISFPLSGSTISYDDSMNLRNILLSLPLPSDSTKAWVAPITFLK